GIRLRCCDSIVNCHPERSDEHQILAAVGMTYDIPTHTALSSHRVLLSSELQESRACLGARREVCHRSGGWRAAGRIFLDDQPADLRPNQGRVATAPRAAHGFRARARARWLALGERGTS